MTQPGFRMSSGTGCVHSQHVLHTCRDCRAKLGTLASQKSHLRHASERVALGISSFLKLDLEPVLRTRDRAERAWSGSPLPWRRDLRAFPDNFSDYRTGNDRACDLRTLPTGQKLSHFRVEDGRDFREGHMMFLKFSSLEAYCGSHF